MDCLAAFNLVFNGQILLTALVSSRKDTKVPFAWYSIEDTGCKSRKIRKKEKANTNATGSGFAFAAVLDTKHGTRRNVTGLTVLT